GGIGILPARIEGRKVLADVAGAARAQDRVGQGVQNGVGVGVPGQAAAIADANAAEDQRTRVVERMDVNSLPDANHSLLHSSKCASANARSSGRVILMLKGSPGMTCTS